MKRLILIAAVALSLPSPSMGEQALAPSAATRDLTRLELLKVQAELLARSRGQSLHNEFRDISSSDLYVAAMRAFPNSDGRSDAPTVGSRVDPLLSLNMNATVLIMHEDDLVQRADGAWVLKASTFARLGACGTEPFAEQVSVLTSRTCSGVLTAANEVLTAGHCMRDNAALGQSRVVIGFRRESAGFPTVFEAANVYEPDQYTFRSKCARADIVKFTLKTAVAAFKPVKFATDPPVRGQAVYALGHPLGLPLKLTSDSTVDRSEPDEIQFISRLDTYEGNSGSPVFNEKHELIGIHTRGALDIAKVPPCWKSMWYSDRQCQGACATKIGELTAPTECDQREVVVPELSPFLQYVEELRKAQEKAGLPFNPP